MAIEITETETKGRWSFLSFILMLATIGVTGIIIVLLIRLIRHWHKRRRMGRTPEEKVFVKTEGTEEVKIDINPKSTTTSILAIQ